MTKERVIPWYQAPKIIWSTEQYQAEGIERHRYDALYDFIIVGGGIAGASSAYELANAGFRTLLLEAEAEVASRGSGNLQGMLYLKLSPHTEVQNELLISGLHYVRQLLQKLTADSLLKKGEDWDDCGLLQLTRSEKEGEKQQQLAELYPPSLLKWVDQAEAIQLAGVPLTAGGLYFPTSGWVSPPAFVEALLKSVDTERLCGKVVTSINRLQREEISARNSSVAGADDSGHLATLDALDEACPLWEVRCEDGSTFRSKGVILAMAEGVATLDPCRHLPFTVVRGQTTTINRDNPLKMVISGEGYIAPAKGVGLKRSTFGATFRRHEAGGYLTDEEHRENIAMLEKSSPELAIDLGLSSEMDDTALQQLALEGRAATRASAMGSMPIVGPIANRERFMADFAAIRTDAKAIPDIPIPWERGLYLTTAHGSRGMISAPISAVLLRDYIIGEFCIEPSMESRMELLPKSESCSYVQLSQALREALHPNRFYYHALRFNQSLD